MEAAYMLICVVTFAVVLVLASVPTPAAARGGNVPLVPTKKKGAELVGTLEVSSQWDWSDHLAAQLRRICTLVRKKKVYVSRYSVRKGGTRSGPEYCAVDISVSGLKGKDAMRLVSAVVNASKRYRVHRFSVKWEPWE
ncbi:hypothetical protein ES707_14127 [subsurface metagenome]